MENKDPQVQLSAKQGFPEELPYIRTCDASETIAGFDNVECTGTQSVPIPNPQEDAVVEKASYFLSASRNKILHILLIFLSHAFCLNSYDISMSSF